MKIRSQKTAFGRAFAAVLMACCGWMGISSAQAHPAGPRAHLAEHFVFADFDGDHRPDFASVTAGANTRYWIAVYLSGGDRQVLAITAPSGGLQIAARDVNGDSFPDVVVTTAWTNQPVAVLLNDGSGKFTTSAVAEFPGAFAVDDDCFTVATQQVFDAAAALGWRGSPAFYRSACRRAFTAIPSRLPSASASSRLASPPVLLFDGRAPPCASL